MNQTYFSPNEAARFLELSPITLSCWRSRGTGPRFIKTGDEQTDRIIYRRRDLERWRAERGRKSTGEAV